MGKTISIYLPDGNARSIKICDIDSSILQGIFIPRTKLKESTKLKELEQQGIYFLIGDIDDVGKPRVYIGEAEKLGRRLYQHNQTKDFWKSAICFISVKKNLNKAHMKFLENYSWNKANELNKCVLDNACTPTDTTLTNSEKDLVLHIFNDLKTIISTLGYPIFEEVKKEKKNLLICKGKDAYAEGEMTDDGLLVFKGSKTNLEESKTAGSWVVNMRKNLIDNGILKKENNILVFTEDYIFNSPSASAAVILARRANGWIEWKDNEGKTIDEKYRK